MVVVGKATKEKEEREVEAEEVLLVVIDQDSLETQVTAWIMALVEVAWVADTAWVVVVWAIYLTTKMILWVHSEVALPLTMTMKVSVIVKMTVKTLKKTMSMEMMSKSKKFQVMMKIVTFKLRRKRNLRRKKFRTMTLKIKRKMKRKTRRKRSKLMTKNKVSNLILLMF
jgi:hypothetical protein